MTVSTPEPGAADDPPRAGRSELGRISIADGVVAKIAAQAAAEVPDVGGPASRGLGRALPGALGGRQASLETLPRASAQVDGSVAVIRLTLSVRWPEPVRQVCTAVRENVRDQVGRLTGLTVPEVGIEVTGLVTELAAPPRVR